MVRRSLQLTALLVLGLLVTAGAGAIRRPLASQVRPHTFASCASLVGYAKGHFASTHGLPEPVIAGDATASTVGTTTSSHGSTGATPGVVGATAATSDVGGSSGTSSTSYSTTNDQEQGVDEPDIAKTDGSTIFTIAGTTLEAVDVTGATEKLAGSLDLGANGTNAQLLLDGNRLLVISTPPFLAYGTLPPIPVALRVSPYWAYGSQTVISEVDVSDPASMAVTQTMTVNGRFVDARQSGGSARIVISSAPQAIAQPQLKGSSSGWVPTWKFHNLRNGRRFTRPVASCSQIRRPVQFSGLGMLNIITVDYAKGLQAAQSTSLMADAQIVYGSTSALYIATQQWVNPELGVMQVPSSQQTVIDKFDVSDADQTTYVASGDVPGYLLNQFSLSEAGGYLRVASTSRPIWWSPDGEPPTALSQSYVTVLQPQNGVLAPVGQVSGLGQGEQIYSVRFDGNTGYVVTYQQVDPLYTIDLSDPTAPKVVGQLDLQGYSAYLQPLGGGLLLGVGQDVSTTTNEPTGAQIELFDVSNPASPQLLAKSSLGAGSSTQVTYDHHAFLWWPGTNLAVLPVQIYGYVTPISCPPNAMCVQPASSGAFNGAVGFTVTGSGIQQLGQVVQDQVNGVTPTIERSIVVGSSLYTVSSQGVMQSSLSTLSRQGFVSFS